ncbi:hypothetical protein KUTeg_019741 [Tegillarca granosa]|uniref:Sialin n=1 Tax=Tegillarca granosa TaxID=220873 RepID=A0ABQ9EIX1_TEGGR|nr:hypothetical protein KUTeg_019741 [Tegillarca granosa]
MGCICVYLIRVNASIAMVCMVKTLTNNSQSNDTLRNISVSSQSACNGEFDWDKSVQSSILSSFFYGYIITQIPGGWLADRFGGRRVIGYTMLISGLLTLITPWSARNFLPLLYVLRALIGSVTLAWAFVWFTVVRDTPADSKRITQAEKDYILSTLEYNPRIRTSSVPWRDVCKSKAVWSNIIAHFAVNWTVYTLMTALPMFMKEVLKFDIKQNGLLSSLPFISNAVFQNVSAQLADFIRPFTGSSICIISTGFIGCDHRYIAVVTLTLSMGFGGLNRAGFVVNHVDYAPKYAGVLLGITNTAGTIPGILSPIVTSVLTPNVRIMQVSLF